jgi:hypothetical protein
MKNAIQRAFAKHEAETKAKAAFAALVETRLQTKLAHAAAAKASEPAPRQSIHYRCR